MSSSTKKMESFCRICGMESPELIHLYDRPAGGRNLVPLIKKYLHVYITMNDNLPHCVCGPCVTKLDEVLDFVTMAIETQAKFREAAKDLKKEDDMSLIDKIKVEIDELSNDMDDMESDGSDYATSRTRKKKKRKVTKKRSVTRCKVKKEIIKSPRISEVKGELNNEEDNDKKVEERLIVDDNKVSKDIKLKKRKKVAYKTRPVRCCECDVNFPKLEELKVHLSEEHPEAEMRMKCTLCPGIFSDIKNLSRHYLRQHDSLQSCPECGKDFEVGYLWSRHMLVHRKTRPFSCDECTKNFKSKGELRTHKKTHMVDEKRYAFCCEVCGKRFTSRANMSNHLKIHAGDRPHICEFCSKSFIQKGQLEEHRRIHTGEKPFGCNICGEKFARQGQYGLHMKAHTGEKPHKCRFCPKSFLRMQTLRQHENVHTDARPFPCSYCDKSFRDQGKRKVHERLHTGERPYVCQFCNKGFTECGNLSKHLKVHSKLSPDKPNDHPGPKRPQDSVLVLNSGSANSVAEKTSKYCRAKCYENGNVCKCSSYSNESIPNRVLLDTKPIGFEEQRNFMLSHSAVGNHALALQMNSSGGEGHYMSSLHARSSSNIEKHDQYRDHSSGPFQSLPWTLYHT